MTLRELHEEIGRMLDTFPWAANDPVIDTRIHSCRDPYPGEFDVTRVVLHDPGESDGYVTLEME